MPSKHLQSHIRWQDGAIASLISSIPFAMFFAIGLSIDFSVQRLEAVLTLFLIGYFWGVLVSAVVGFPLFLASRAMGIANWLTAVAAGTAIGLLALLVFKYPAPISLREAASSGSFGAFSGLTFWLAVQFLAFRRNRI